MSNARVQALQPVIRQILSAPGTDLATISAKRVRKQLLELDPSLDSDFIRDQKQEIDNLIALVYEQISADNQQSASADPDDDDDDDAGSSQYKRKREDASDDEGGASLKKPKKGKTKQEKQDAVLARQLSNELNGRGRTSRAGSSTKKGNGTKRGGRKGTKSSATVDSDGDEGLSGDEEKPKKRRGGGGFTKEYALSPPLVALLNVDKLSRPQIVKALWVHIKANNMQNPENKKEIVCDEKFRAIFKVDRIDMFKMNKELGQHLYETPAAS